ncbi:MAG TPA: ABC transporter substrate-binding protein [Phototrophicaceae bacterium]|nr:ABC transporter substrate-binding protein [Phototrophicaceae bacterium]
MKIRSTAVLALMMVVVALLLSSFSMVSAQSDTIKIGLGFDLSGAESSLDLPASNGAMLAIKEINANGGILGKQVEGVSHDTRYDMALTAQVAHQFVEQDQVSAVVGFTDSDSVLAAGPIIQAAHIPFITAGATSPLLPDQVGDMFFMACFGDNVQASAMAEYAYKNFGHTAYLLWDQGVEYTTLLAGYFKTRFTQLGGTIVLEDTYADDATDFSTQITKLRALSTQPDFYFVSAMPYNVGPAVLQMRQAGIDGPITGGDGYDTPDIVSVAGDSANNVYFTTHALMDPDNGTDAIKGFFKSYTAEYGHAPENAFAALGYDAMNLLADAITRAGSTDADAIQQALLQTSNFPGVTGSITFANGSHIPQKAVTIIKIADQKFTLAQQLVPEVVAPANPEATAEATEAMTPMMTAEATAGS